MKRICLSTLFLLLCFISSSAQDDDKLDFGVEEMLTYESVYKHQPLKFPRASIDNPLTLKSQIEQLFNDVPTFTDAYVCVGSQFDITDKYYSKAEDVLKMDPILLAFDVDKDKNIKRKYFEPNVVIYLGFNAKDGTKKYLVYHERVRGMMNGRLYARMTFEHPRSTGDDCLTYNSETAPMTGSYITVFDATDPTKDLEYFDSVEKSMEKKFESNENITTADRAVMTGSYELHESHFNNSYADWLMSEGRYLDAHDFYERAYLYNRSDIFGGDDKVADLFYGACYGMGKSLENVGNKDESLYYMSLASYADTTRIADENRILNLKWDDCDANSYQSFDGKSLDLNKVTVGQMLNTVFDVLPVFIENGKVITSGEKKSKDLTAQDAWNLDLKSLCKDKPSCVTLRYTKAGYAVDSPVDKSKLLSDNVIVITVNRASGEKSLWRVNIMIPNFRSSDSKRENTKINRPRFLSFIIGNDTRTWDMNNDGDILKQCESLMNENRSAEALAGEKYVFAKYKDDFSDSQEKYDLYSTSASYYAFSLNEFDCYAKAYYYHLCNIMNGDANEYLPFINDLINLSDPRALDGIDGFVSQIDERMKTETQNAESLKYIKINLLRRKGYVLIELGQLDEAETLYNSLLKETDDAQFIKNVKGELDYIKQMRSSQK